MLLNIWAFLPHLSRHTTSEECPKNIERRREKEVVPDETMGRVEPGVSNTLATKGAQAAAMEWCHRQTKWPINQEMKIVPLANRVTLEKKNIDSITSEEELIEDIFTELNKENDKWIIIKSLRTASGVM